MHRWIYAAAASQTNERTNRRRFAFCALPPARRHVPSFLASVASVVARKHRNPAWSAGPVVGRIGAFRFFKPNTMQYIISFYLLHKQTFLIINTTRHNNSSATSSTASSASASSSASPLALSTAATLLSLHIYSCVHQHGEINVVEMKL